jgi:hypothetical protein
MLRISSLLVLVYQLDMEYMILDKCHIFGF